MINNVPWFVGGGAEHSAAQARNVLFNSTSGATGVAGTDHLKVVAQGTPNGTVSVMPGTAVIASTYTGASNESYGLRNRSATSVTVQPTGSATGRSDAVVLTVTDPEFIGSAPADVNAFEYAKIEVVSGVSATLTDVRTLNLGKPATLLARLDIPKSTGAITNAMINDLRIIANPRRLRRIYTRTTAGNTVVKSGTDFKTYMGDFTIDIPLWATSALVDARITGPWQDGRIDNPYYIFGGVRVNAFGQVNPYEQFQKSSIRYGTRHDMTTAGTFTIPAEHRGTTRSLGIQLAHWAGNDLNVDSNCTAKLDIEFVQDLT